MAKKKTDTQNDLGPERELGEDGNPVRKAAHLEPPPEPEVDEDFERVSGLVNQEAEGRPVNQENMVREDDPMTEVNRKMDNQAEVERFVKERKQNTTVTGNDLRKIPQIAEEVRQGKHGAHISGNEGERVTR